jgi:hypothetical protein
MNRDKLRNEDLVNSTFNCKGIWGFLNVQMGIWVIFAFFATRQLETVQNLQKMQNVFGKGSIFCNFCKSRLSDY